MDPTAPIRVLARRIRRRVRRSVRRWAAKLAETPNAPYPALSLIQAMFDSENSAPQLLYLGDSVTGRVANEDTDRRTLAAMLADALQDELNVGSVHYSGYHMRVFYHLLRALEHMRHQPRIVLLPINIRSFSPQWDLNPQWQCTREQSILERYYADPQQPVPPLRPLVVTPDQAAGFAAREVSYPFSEFTTVGQFQELIATTPLDDEQKAFRRRQIFVFHYMHVLRADHPKLALLTEIVRMMRERGIKLALYVTPVNYEAGERYLGPGFREVLAANVGVVEATLAPMLGAGVEYADLSTMLEADQFFHLEETTEHLNERGRMTLATRLAALVRQARTATPAVAAMGA